MATAMETYLKKALDSQTRKGIRPTKYTMVSMKKRQTFSCTIYMIL